MPRIPVVPDEEASWLLRFANRYTRKQRGTSLEPTRIMGHQSWILGGAGAMEMALERSSHVPSRLKSLAGLKAAARIGCPF